MSACFDRISFDVSVVRIDTYTCTVHMIWYAFVYDTCTSSAVRVNQNLWFM